ncbi:MAG: Ribosomal RNA small subunit methyltransferase D [bacterium]|nr:Ribosomal RNA small subunit methyltransferase D [bacterium]
MLKLQIEGGRLKGAIVHVAHSPSIRPTLARVREAAFNAWQFQVPGSLFIDGFAGSGLMGLEAWSRGAERIIAIEQDPLAVRRMREAVRRLGGERNVRQELERAWSVRQGSVEKEVLALAAEGVQADLIYLDPPYHYAGLSDLITLILDIDLLRPGGELMIECADRDTVRLPPPDFLTGGHFSREHRHGGTRLVRYEADERPEAVPG